ncbi:MAG: DNA-protecting protein DprA [Planctomycetes bacterium]|nr:DNA-protecting protein DprA [Planctomycetota bacterium]
MSGDDLESLVALNLTGMVGAVLCRRLVERFGSSREALAAPMKRLREVEGVGEITARAITAEAKAGRARKELDQAAHDGIRILPFDAPEYPAPLRTIYDPPVVLYLKGTWSPEDALSIGIVGSRKCTPYGERQAARFATELASVGVTVVSGLARGIDTKAHLGALQAANGRTVAVLGSGLCRIYPPENAKLMESVGRRGCVISEFGLEAGPEPENFPRRNRLISGLSLGVLVVEAAEKSGALITADWAMEQGREVFALPGALENPMSRGPHALIKQGAKLVENIVDLLEEIPALAPVLAKVGRPAALTPIEGTVLSRVQATPRSSEAIAAAARLPEASVAAALTQLVAKKMVCVDEGKFVRPKP